MIFDLPYPPSLNTLYPTNRSGKRVLSARGRAYKTNVYAEILSQHKLFKPLTGPLRASVRLWVPDKRKRDLDNCFKAILDSLKYANVYLDDDQIVEIHGYKLERVKGGKCQVEILPVENKSTD